MESHKIYLDNLSLTVTDTSIEVKRALGKQAKYFRKPTWYQKAKKDCGFSLRMDGKGLDKSFSVFTEEGKVLLKGSESQANYNANETNAMVIFRVSKFIIESKLAGRSELFQWRCR